MIIPLCLYSEPDTDLSPTCHKCDTRIPNLFSFSGPHIKQYCAHCNAYIKFAQKSAIPSYIESKNKIWTICQDQQVIDKLKNKMGVFNDKLKGKIKDVYYHNLYVHVVMLFT